MAAKSKRTSKTNVFWSRDRDDQDERIVKIHVPGVAPGACIDVKNPMVRKPVHMIKPRVVTLQKSLHNSLEKRTQGASRSGSSTKNITDSFLTTDTGHFGGSHLEGRKKEKKELGLKELNPQDKKRVANLVKELAKVGEERQFAEERIKEERVAFEERLAILQEEYYAVIKEKAYLQNRFLELQSLLVKYQANGRTPSPRKAAKTPTREENEQVSGILSAVSPNKPAHFSPSKPPLTEIQGNTRPDITTGPGASGEKLDVRGFQTSLSQQVRNNTPLLNNRTRKPEDQKLQSVGLHNSSVSVGDVRRSFSSQLALSPNVQSSIESRPVATSGKVQVTPPSHVQVMEIPLSSGQRKGPSCKAVEPSETSVSPQATSAGSSQSAVTAVPGGMSQYLPQAKPMFSVFGEGGPEVKMPPRKNEDRSFSEVSGVSGSFSAELDAVYRLYCREYELQLQLQQQQIELQKQQLQLQQQLQQVETLQQQQQQQQQRQQQQQQQQQQQEAHPSTSYVPSATKATTAAGHEKHFTSVVDETPAPSPVPRPTSQPRQVSPARSLIPTPEGSSCNLANSQRLPGGNQQKVRHVSAAGAYWSRDEGSERAGLASGNEKSRLELEKENREPLIPDPHNRVQSAPPNLGHPRLAFARQEPRLQNEFQAPPDRSYRRGVVPGYEKPSIGDKLLTTQEHVDGRASANYPASRLSSSAYSLHRHGHDVFANRQSMTLRERQNTEQDVFSGRRSNSSFYPRSNYMYDINSEQASFAADSFQTDSLLNGARRTDAESSLHGLPISQSRIQGSFNRQSAGRGQRFSLYSDIERDSQSRGSQTFPDDDYRHHRLEQSTVRAPHDNAYPLSLVDIVEGLENKPVGPEDPVAAGGLDTTDSGYSQETYKERSPLTSDNVNSDDEEAAVIEDIFFLSGRFL